MGSSRSRSPSRLVRQLVPTPSHQTQDTMQKIITTVKRNNFAPSRGKFPAGSEATFPRLPRAVAGKGLPAGLQGAAPAAEPRACRSGAGRREPGPAAAAEGSRGARHLRRRGAGLARSRALPSARPVPVRSRCGCGGAGALPGCNILWK